MLDVQISEQADRDLRDIFEYIAFELLAPENAAGQLDRLEDAISKLDNLPEKFRRYEREPWKSRETEYYFLRKIGKPVFFFYPKTGRRRSDG